MSTEGEPRHLPDSSISQGATPAESRVDSTRPAFPIAEVGLYVLGLNLLAQGIFSKEDLASKLPIYGALAIFFGLTDRRFPYRSK